MLEFRVPAAREEFSAMSHIHAAGWRTTYVGHVPEDYLEQVITDEHWTDLFQAANQKGSYHSLTLCRDGEIVSCLNYGPIRVGTVSSQSLAYTIQAADYQGWAEIITFYTRPDETGKGYGGMLLEEACRRLRAEGYPSVYVFVLDKNQRSRAFYERHGFSWDGTWEDIPFPHGYICRDLRYIRAL